MSIKEPGCRDDALHEWVAARALIRDGILWRIFRPAK
jgi:hypothetical protein